MLCGCGRSADQIDLAAERNGIQIQMRIQAHKKLLNGSVIHAILFAELSGSIAGSDFVGINHIFHIFIFCGREEIALACLHGIEIQTPLTVSPGPMV